MISGVGRIMRLAAATALVTTLAPVLAGMGSADAQTPAKPPERMVVDARELVYDRDKNTVSAVGDVQILYQGRTIEADRVVYDRISKRVLATGNARITEANGTVITGDRFNLTDDFRDGFIDSLRVVNTDKTRFAAPRAERTDGEVFVFEKGTYTACEPCKDNPERPPLWQVRAARIIHKKSEQMIYYEDARLEFAGIPMAYIPYMSGPDATVKRKTGFLSPKFINTSALGMGVSLPYFINLAPNYDLTLTPTYLSRQGFLGQAEWRHRFVNGSYSIRAAGIFQQDKSAFLVSPLGAGDDKFRGSLETSGKVYLNPRWTFNWDIAGSTDRFFFKNYRIRSESITAASFLQESVSTAALQGQSPTAWFDMRGYYFQPLNYNDWQKQQPVVLPVVDYNKRVHKPSMIGGELSFTVNLTALTREAAAYRQLPQQSVYLINVPAVGTRPTYSLFDGCAVYSKDTCLVRGIAGSVARATAEVAWRRNFIDPLGQVWMPYVSARADIFSINPNTTDYANAGVKTIADATDDVFGRVMPTAGLLYRYPFVATTTWGTHMLEPIAQVIFRPNETNSLRVANEDAQSLVFDDTNLFEWNKFSGYDRVEGGSRANVGLRYSGTFGQDSYANLLLGQSYHLGGRNSYASGDLANTGLDSGLETRRSDFVARAQLQPFKGLLFQGGARFDESTLEAQRIDASASYTHSIFTSSVTYGRYEPQPDLGISRRREGLSLNQSVKFAQYWSVRGGVLFDLDKYKYDRERYRNALVAYQQNGGTSPIWPNTGPFQTASLSAGLRYQDECTVFDVSYTQSYADRQAGAKNDTRTLMFRLELRTLGEVSYSQSIGSSSADGVSTTSN